MHVLIFVCNIALAVAHQKYRYSESFVHLNVAAKYLQMTIVPGENAVKTSAHTRTHIPESSQKVESRQFGRSAASLIN